MYIIVVPLILRCPGYSLESWPNGFYTVLSDKFFLATYRSSEISGGKFQTFKQLPMLPATGCRITIHFLFFFLWKTDVVSKIWLLGTQFHSKANCLQWVWGMSEWKLTLCLHFLREWDSKREPRFLRPQQWSWYWKNKI